MESLVIGKGEIGRGISETLNCQAEDKHYEPKGEFKVLHICFGYADDFEVEVERYVEMYSPELVIIHSTVPVGTCSQLGAVHSPVRGRHPNLAEGVKTFTKFFGGERAEEGAELFRAVGVKCVTTEKSETTEAMKLWDTTIYGVNIALEKRIFTYCQEHGLDFDVVYTQANKTYNEGYEALGEPQFKKYVLEHVDGKIGGHCILSNLPLLDDKEVTEWITRN